MTTTEAFIALNRFGLGPRAGDLARVAHDPKGWLEAQVDMGSVAPRMFADLPSSSEVGRSMMEMRRMAERGRPDQAARRAMRERGRDVYRSEAVARTRQQIETDRPFVERLVQFWSNHFTVSVRRPPVMPLAGAFEREAIRPHVLGGFRDLLGAAVAHPAMLVYLDNIRSVGPRSPAGRRRNRGLNENLAREVLELHTLGSDGGYTQEDVVALARILTGWSIGRNGRGGTGGGFAFQPRLHEPGAKSFLGARIPEAGREEGERALDMLAGHPATARQLALKLARHFVADDPPADAVERLAAVFRESAGDLTAVARALIRLPAVWIDPLPKVKSANGYVVSALRAMGGTPSQTLLLESLSRLGQAPFTAPSPQGWPDRAERWAAPEAVMRRAEWAYAIARRLPGVREPRALLAETIAPVAHADTVRAVERAPSAAEAVALVLASPEFQRR